MKRWLIITYCKECGLDEKTEHEYLLNAHKAAKSYLKAGYDEIYIFDKKENRVAYLYNGYYIPSEYFSVDVDTKNAVIFTPKTIKAHAKKGA